MAVEDKQPPKLHKTITFNKESDARLLNWLANQADNFNTIARAALYTAMEIDTANAHIETLRRSIGQKVRYHYHNFDITYTLKSLSPDGQIAHISPDYAPQSAYPAETEFITLIEETETGTAEKQETPNDKPTP